MAVDAWIDSTLYEAGFKASEIWETLTIFSRRFRFMGWKRAVFEILGEGFTIGAAGCVVMLALALPAFEETAGNWRAQDDFAVTFLDRQGNEIGQRGIIQRDSIPVDEMPDHVIKAVLATEDRRFFEHYGIDFLGLIRAMSENVRANSVVQGGSSITQQLAKNLFLSNERTVERKVKEAFLAIWLETNLSKKDILQLYLDRAYMGGGTFGIAAAADFYFGKSVKDLNLPEAAMLAGLFKAPAKYAPHINLPAARARANVVLTNMVQGGFMTEGQVLSARLHPADIVDRGYRKSPDYFLDWAFEEVKTHHRQVGRALDGGANHGRHEHTARHGRSGRVQSAPARQGIRRHRRRRRRDGDRRRGAGDRRRPGLRRKPVQPRDERASPDRFVVQGLCLRDRHGTWVHAGIGHIRRSDLLGQMVAEKLWPQLCGRHRPGHGAGEVHQHRAGQARQGPSGHPADQGDGRGHGRGIDGEFAQDHGARDIGHDRHGSGDRLQRLHATTAMPALRHGITQIFTRSGDVLYDYEKDAADAAARPVRSGAALDELHARPGSRTRHRAQALRCPTSGPRGKTGTTQSYRDAWYIGFTGNYLAAVWLGNDDFSPTRNMTGGSLPAMIWQRLMTYAHQNVDIKPIPGIENAFVDEQVAAKDD